MAFAKLVMASLYTVQSETVDANKQVLWCQTSSKTTLLKKDYSNHGSYSQTLSLRENLHFTNCTFSADETLIIPPHTEECLEWKAVAQTSSFNGGAKPYALQLQVSAGKCKSAQASAVGSEIVSDVDVNGQVQWCQTSSKTTVSSTDYNNQGSYSQTLSLRENLQFTNCTFSVDETFIIPPHTEECVEWKAVALTSSFNGGAKPYVLQLQVSAGKCKSAQLSAVGSEIVPDVDVNGQVQWCETSSLTTLLQNDFNNQESDTMVYFVSQNVRFTNCTFSARIEWNIPPHTEECLEVKAVAQKSSSNGAKPYALQYELHTGKCKSANVASVVI